jgi:hypothetical protein
MAQVVRVGDYHLLTIDGDGSAYEIHVAKVSERIRSIDEDAGTCQIDSFWLLRVGRPIVCAQ